MKSSHLLSLSFFATLLMAFIVPVTVFAANINVTFQDTPLFSESSFVPGDIVSKAVTVFNDSQDEKTIATEGIFSSQTLTLSNTLLITIKQGSTILFSDTLANFFTASPIILSTIPKKTIYNYIYTIHFPSNSGNNLANAQLLFDVCVGVAGGSRLCSQGELAENLDEPGNLVIQHQRVVEVVQEPTMQGNQVMIRWDTNKHATSQVVYGRVDQGPYVLNLNVLPFLGYPLGTVEDVTLVKSHAVFLSNITPNVLYAYRVVSRASPASVSSEHYFIVSPTGSVTEFSSLPNPPKGNGGWVGIFKNFMTESLPSPEGLIAFEKALENIAFSVITPSTDSDNEPRSQNNASSSASGANSGGQTTNLQEIAPSIQFSASAGLIENRFLASLKNLVSFLQHNLPVIFIVFLFGLVVLIIFFKKGLVVSS